MKRSPQPGSIDRALAEIDTLLASLNRSLSVSALHELLLLLDGECPAALDRRLSRYFTRSHAAARNRKILAVHLQHSLDHLGPGCIVDTLYRTTLGVFPDPGGMQHYSSILARNDLTALEVMHLLATSRPLPLLLHAALSPGLLFHFPGGLLARWRLHRGKPGLQEEDTARTSSDHASRPDSAPNAIMDPTLPLPEESGRSAGSARPRVAVVVHRAGEGFSGGAERAAVLIARYLSHIASTEIFTTCARDYLTWRNEIPPGRDRLEGIPVQRFPVSRERNLWWFQRLSSLLRFLLEHGAPSIVMHPLCRMWMRAQGPSSPALLDYLQKNREAYDCFVFVTYLYDTTYSGLPIVADRAVLIPTAHKEWPLRLPIWKGFFRTVERCIFLAEEERRFLRDWFPGLVDGPVTGCGVDEPPAGLKPQAFRDFSGIRGPYMLYTGRVDPEKGCRRLIGLFTRYIRETGRDITLVLLGSRQMVVPLHERIYAPGFVSREILESALSGCALYVHPSPYESLSFSLLEAMQLGRPLLVTAESDVLRSHVRRSRGGLSYGNADEFFTGVESLLKSPQRFVGGPAYVRKRYSHGAVSGPLNRWMLDRIHEIRGTSQSLPDPKNASFPSR